MSNGQTLTLNLKQTGSKLKGTAQIANATALPRLASGAQNLLSVQIPPGLLPIEGTFTAPRGFDLRATDGSFSVKGNFATPTLPGTYDLTLASGQTDSGTVPPTGQTTPTPTPQPTTSPTASPTTGPMPTQTATPTPPTPTGPAMLSASPALTFSETSADLTLVNRTPLNTFDQSIDNELFNTTGSQNYQSVRISGGTGDTRANTGRALLIAFSGVPDIRTAASNFKVGDTRNFNAFNVAKFVSENGGYNAKTGTMTITKIVPNFISIAIDAVFVADGFTGNTGSFRLKGTLNATNVKVTELKS